MIPISEPVAQYCVLCGHALQSCEQSGELQPVCPNCGWVYYEDPKVAVAALIIQNDKVLLIRRAIQPAIGKWTLPAGFMNAHEDPREAIARECREETGLNVNVHEVLQVISGREHPRGADLLLVYHAEITGGSLRSGDDTDAVDFFPLDALPPLAFKSTSAILKTIKAGE